MFSNHVVQQKMRKKGLSFVSTQIFLCRLGDIVLVRSRLVPQSEGAARFTSLLVNRESNPR